MNLWSTITEGLSGVLTVERLQRFLFAAIPVGALLVALVLLAFYPLSQAHAPAIRLAETLASILPPGLMRWLVAAKTCGRRAMPFISCGSRSPAMWRWPRTFAGPPRADIPTERPAW